MRTIATTLIAAAALLGASAAALAASDDAYLVIGAQPYRSNLIVATGTLDGETFIADSSNDTYDDTDGFVIIKVRHGGTIAVTGVKIYAEDHIEAGVSALGYGMTHALGFLSNEEPGWSYQPYSLCDGPHAVTFTLAPGQVVYATNVDIKLDPDLRVANRLTLSFSTQMAAARVYLEAHKPGLVEKLEQGSYTLREARNCSTN